MRIADLRWIPVVLLTFVGYANGAPTDVQVNCSQGKSINDAISKLTDSDKDYSVTVSGACTENVSISQFPGNSLVLQGDGSASTSLTGVSSNLPGTSVIQVVSSRLVTIQNLTIHVTGTLPTGQVAGVSLVFCSRCNVSNVTITTPRVGVGISDSQGNLINLTVNVNGTQVGDGVSVVNTSDVNLIGIQLHGPGGTPPTGTGLFVDSSSHARLEQSGPSSTVAIDGFGIGITVRGNSYLEGGTSCSGSNPQTICGTVSGFSQGMRLESGRAFLTGISVSATTTTNPPGQSILVATESTLEMIAPVNISVPFGVALAVTHNSHAALFGNLFGFTITGVAPRAVSIGAVSSVQFNGPVTINGSGVNCDALSMATGTGNVTPLNLFGGCPNTNSIPTPMP
jgi:hypothetical protein